MNKNTKKCKLCYSENIRLIHKGTRDNPEMDVYRCENCGLKFLLCESGMREDQKEYYENGGMHYGNPVKYAEERVKALAQDDARKCEEVKDFIKEKSVLDFGCGYGGALLNMKRFAKSVTGVEWGREERKYLSAKGVNVASALAECGEKYDVITLFHVFEHLDSPKEYLCKFKNFLVPGGYLFLEVPHAEDALLELYHCEAFADFTYWSPHLFLYNRNTMRILAESCGYTIVDMHGVQRYSVANHLYWLSKGKPGGDKVWDFFDDTAIKQWYEERLDSLEMTDTLLVLLTPQE